MVTIAIPIANHAYCHRRSSQRPSFLKHGHMGSPNSNINKTFSHYSGDHMVLPLVLFHHSYGRYQIHFHKFHFQLHSGRELHHLWYLVSLTIWNYAML